MLVGLIWIDAMDARSEIDAAEKRGVAPGLVRNLRDTLEQAIQDDDDDSVQALAKYAARLGPSGSMTVDTPADVVVGGAVETARTVQTAAAATEGVLVIGAVLAALVLVTGRR